MVYIYIQVQTVRSRCVLPQIALTTLSEKLSRCLACYRKKRGSLPLAEVRALFSCSGCWQRDGFYCNGSSLRSVVPPTGRLTLARHCLYNSTQCFDLYKREELWTCRGSHSSAAWVKHLRDCAEIQAQVIAVINLNSKRTVKSNPAPLHPPYQIFGVGGVQGQLREASDKPEKPMLLIEQTGDDRENVTQIWKTILERYMNKHMYKLPLLKVIHNFCLLSGGLQIFRERQAYDISLTTQALARAAPQTSDETSEESARVVQPRSQPGWSAKRIQRVLHQLELRTLTT
eukprot:TRINITY_DN639_c1_g1_i11.p1 TRINITY_DN639_c1_g1~~TRINITY_DN639_c1_g1_i11.p1  ORF type:complete len:287 (-),score=-11.65 TRINITY_DN639_c1_g1_i11:1232-2092(-)